MLFNSHLDPADHHPAMNLSPLDEVVERGAVGELQACLGPPLPWPHSRFLLRL